MLEMLSFCLLLNFCHLCYCFADMGLVIDSSLWKLSCWTSLALPSLTALLPAGEAQCRDLLSSVLPKLLQLYLMCVDLIYCAFKQVSMCTTCSYCICLLDTRNWLGRCWITIIGNRSMYLLNSVLSLHCFVRQLVTRFADTWLRYKNISTSRRNIKIGNVILILMGRKA